ncbi:MFS transporter [Brevibacillus fluminis]|uniref:MFS transporter n=1 Tax=Brevibacillus fluminis TaxID=511487 RepID=UPI003F8BDF24
MQSLFRQSKRNESLMTAILCFAGLAVMSSLYVTIPLLSLFADRFHVTPTQAAAVGTAFSIGFALGCLLYGSISDKYGRKQVIFSGLLALTIISLFIGMVDQLPWLIPLRAFQGLAAASFSPVALAYAVEMFPAKKRVTTIGFISTGFLLAGIAGQVLASLLCQQYGWQSVFYVLSAVYAITAVLVFVFLPKGEIQQPQASVFAAFRRIGHVLRQKNLLLSDIVAFVLLLSFVSMYTILGDYLKGPAFGLTSQQILAVRAAGAIGMLVSPFAGRFAKRIGIRTLLRCGLSIAIIGLLGLGVSSNLALLVTMSLVFVTGIALSVPALVSLVGQLGGASRGIAVSVYTFVLFSGTSVGPLLSIQFVRLGGYAAAFALVACVLFAGLLASLLITRETAEAVEG